MHLRISSVPCPMLQQRVRGVLSTLQDIKLSAARKTLMDDGLFWSPKRPLESHPTRPSPMSPLGEGGTKRVKVTKNLSE